MDQQDNTPLEPPAWLVESLARSEADIAAGRIEDFDIFMARVDRLIADGKAELELKRTGKSLGT